MGKFKKEKKFDRKEFGKTTKFREDDNSERPRKRESGFDRRDSGREQGFHKSDSGFQLHHAVCDKCGKDCDVPFKPTGNKPIYCRSCYNAGASKQSNFDRRAGPDRFENKSASNVSKEDIDKINRKLDRIMKALKIE